MWMHLSAPERSLGPQYSTNKQEISRQSYLIYPIKVKKVHRTQDCRGSVRAAYHGDCGYNLKRPHIPPHPTLQDEKGKRKTAEKNCEEELKGEPQRFIIAIAGSGCGIEAEGDKKKLRRQGGRQTEEIPRED